MFLTRSPVCALSDDIGNRDTFHETNDCLLFGSLASTVSVVNACALTGSACDNNRTRHPLNNCTMVCNLTTSVTIHVLYTMHICFMLRTLAYGAEGLHFSAFIDFCGGSCIMIYTYYENYLFCRYSLILTKEELLSSGS